MQRRITVLLAACLSLTANAQVISGWNDDSGIIHTWAEDNEDPQGFSNTLEEFSDAKTDLEQMADPENLPEIGRRTITINGKEAQVPTMIVDGIDFYMLMPEGISIYMGANPTAFYEEPDQDTIKWIRYYAFFKRKYTSRIFKRFEEWQEFISNTMLSESIPEEIGLLCLIESGCTYAAVSRVGATGMWQFMPAAAREMGLEVSEYKDQRTDPIASTKAAAKYLKNLYKKTGSWTLAIASYNCGIGRTESLVKRHKTKSWAELKSSFPTETQQYIPALQAIHYVWTYRDQLGL